MKYLLPVRRHPELPKDWREADLHVVGLVPVRARSFGTEVLRMTSGVGDCSTEPLLYDFCNWHKKLLKAKTSLMFAPFYTLYALIVAIAIVVWIVIRRLQ
jgi:hypothetical protein